ncbi:alpha/beta hydrolase [Rosettibacter firmus]|uniref:alpha/beta hydrolase n=1 Tax=Rosettibacter firmus TaxID=3111522 RepID=UPI00336C18E0
MKYFDPVTQDPIYVNNRYSSSMRPVVFESNGCKVLGTLLLASGEELHPVIILLHGFPGNETNMDLAHVFRRQGFNVLIFHYRGCWGSEGDYSWKNLIEDLDAAIKFLRTDESKDLYRIDSKKIILIGYSMGGFAAMYYSVFHKEIKNVASIAGFNPGAFGEILELSKEIYEHSLDKINFATQLVKNTTAEKLLNELIEYKNEWNLLNYVSKLSQKNLLLIAAEYDSTAPLEIHHIPLVAALSLINAENFVQYVLGCGHSFIDKRIELARIISNWLSRVEF